MTSSRAVAVGRLALGTACAEAIGLVLAGAVSALVAGRVAEGGAIVLTIAGGLVVGMLEGALVGVGQAWALRRDRVVGRKLVVATSAGFAVGWTIGIGASMIGVEAVFGEALATDWGSVLGAPLVGSAFGAIVGMFQASSVADLCPRGRWVGGSALAWGLGFLPPQGLSLLMQYEGTVPDAAWMTALSGILTGAVVGSVLGASLSHLGAQRTSADFAV
jgi:hypothetical protein